MIAPLRARHRAMTRVLAVVLPALFVLALAARPEREEDPPVEQAPAAAARLEGDLSASVWLDPEGRLVVLPDEDPRLPDLLLYWSSSAPVDGELPGGARLLGALAGGRRRVLPAPPESGGSLVAYSLGHGRVVGSGPVPGPVPSPVPTGGR